MVVHKGELADDVVLLASTRHGAEVAAKAYSGVANAFGLSVSVQKTKFVVVGKGVSGEDQLPLSLGDGDVIERVSSFPYLGSLMAENGRVHDEVDRRIAGASRAFGALRHAVFKDYNLSIATKRAVYRACVLSVLLYGSECWVPLKRDVKKLNSFHHRCIRVILGITNQKQWTEYISSAMVREWWGDVDSIGVKLIRRRLEWLGHLARMPQHCLPKLCLFGWLPATRPLSGPRRRWRDLVKSDMRVVGLGDEDWFSAAQDRDGWRGAWQQSLINIQAAQGIRRSSTQKNVRCEVCQRSFTRESDKARHKCLRERSKPIHSQAGAVQCVICDKWFRSRGGLTACSSLSCRLHIAHTIYCSFLSFEGTRDPYGQRLFKVKVFVCDQKTRLFNVLALKNCYKMTLYHSVVRFIYFE